MGTKASPLVIAEHVVRFLGRAHLVQDPTLLSMLNLDHRLPVEAVLSHPAFCRLGISSKELLDAAKLVDPRLVEVDCENFTLIPKMEGVRNVLIIRELAVSLDALRTTMLSAPCLKEQQSREDQQEPMCAPWLASRPHWQQLLTLWLDGDLCYAEFSTEGAALEVALYLKSLEGAPFKVAVKSASAYAPQSARALSGLHLRLAPRADEGASPDDCLPPMYFYETAPDGSVHCHANPLLYCTPPSRPRPRGRRFPRGARVQRSKREPDVSSVTRTAPAEISEGDFPPLEPAGSELRRDSESQWKLNFLKMATQ